MKYLSGALRTPKRKFAFATAAVLMAGTGAAVAVGPLTHTGDASYGTFHVVDQCRILDTRNGTGGHTGKIGSLQTLTFHYGVSGDPCTPNPIPDGIFLVTASVTAVDADKKGYLRQLREDNSCSGLGGEPTATFLNYGTNYNTNVVSTIRGCGVDGRYTFKNYGGPTHLVIDVLGYWVP
jgi:hypothetical protein